MGWFFLDFFFSGGDIFLFSFFGFFLLLEGGTSLGLLVFLILLC